MTQPANDTSDILISKLGMKSALQLALLAWKAGDITMIELKKVIDMQTATHDAQLLELLLVELPKERELLEPVTRKPITDGDKVVVDVDADPKGSLVFVQDNGFNMARKEAVEAIKNVFRGKQ